MASCINLQLPIVILKNSTLLDMHHRITSMYIKFQQNRVSRSVKTVLTSIFAKIRKLHKFATTNSNFEKMDYFKHVSLYTTCISIFKKMGFVDQPKQFTQVYLQKYESCINLQLPIIVF